MTATATRTVILILRADITRLDVDAVVNAASEEFRGGGGVDGAIHRAAGPELLRECERHPRLPTGSAVVTRGYRLPARWIVHTVGPVWRGGAHGEPALLAAAYASSFRAALDHGGIGSIAFPAVSTGVYGYPKRPAAVIALSAMLDFAPRFQRIVACVHDADDEAVYRETFDELLLRRA